MPVAPGADGQYFGWWPVSHAPGCPRPAWEVAVHTDHRSGESTVRVLCRSCERVELYSGVTTRESSSTREIGYGQPPRRVAGVWLYPGPAFMADESDPWDYLVARERRDQLGPDDVIGWIGQQSGPRRAGLAWKALAGPGQITDEGRFMVHATTERVFKTIRSAAGWIGTQ